MNRKTPAVAVSRLQDQEAASLRLLFTEASRTIEEMKSLVGYVGEILEKRNPTILNMPEVELIRAWVLSAVYCTSRSMMRQIGQLEGLVRARRMMEDA